MKHSHTCWKNLKLASSDPITGKRRRLVLYELYSVAICPYDCEYKVQGNGWMGKPLLLFVVKVYYPVLKKSRLI